MSLRFNTIMFSYFWILLGIISFLLIQCSSGQADQCDSGISEFLKRADGKVVPPFCSAFNKRFDTYGSQYRIDFTESEVESVCNSTVCKDFMESITLSCITFVRKYVSFVVNNIYGCMHLCRMLICTT